jgi:putative spermidine/putrescine transport system substrate-binding protein
MTAFMTRLRYRSSLTAGPHALREWTVSLHRVASAAVCITLVAGLPARAACAQTATGSEALPPVASSAAAQSLTIATWGGAYARAQATAVFQPFSATTGIRLVVERHQGPGRDGERLRTAIETPPDVLDLSSGTLAEACTEGLLEQVDVSRLAPDPGTGKVEGDFLPGAITDCGVGTLAWSAVFVVDRSQFKGPVPTTIAEVFDVVRYPGRRALPRSPRFLLEAALLADSVHPDEVYAVLDTEEGVTHAFENLRRLTADVVWWEPGSEPIRTIRDRHAAIGLAFNGRVFLELASLPAYSVIWDGQIYDMSYWAIAKSSRNKDAAAEFVRFATAPEQLAATARLFPYGPVRRSAVARLGQIGAADVDLAARLPTASRNMQRALRFDVAWWARNERRLVERFEIWLRDVGRKPG